MHFCSGGSEVAKREYRDQLKAASLRDQSVKEKHGPYLSKSVVYIGKIPEPAKGIEQFDAVCAICQAEQRASVGKELRQKTIIDIALVVRDVVVQDSMKIKLRH